DFTRAASRHDCWQAWYHRAVAQIHLERLTHALADIGEAVKRNPRSRVCLVIRGCLYAHYGRWDQAAEDLAQAHELGETRPWVLSLHALVCLRREDVPRYESLVRQMLEQAEKGRDLAAGAWGAWTALLGTEPSGNVERLLSWAERARAANREVGSA